MTLPRHDRLPAPLLETLAAVADRLAGLAEPWWVIGSAAAALHGLEDTTVGDVDIVTSTAAAGRLLPARGLVAVDDDGTGLFRSDIFTRLIGLPLKVEILGGLHVRGRPLAIETRIAVPIGANPVYLPSRAELIGILRLFGRPKDIARAAALAALD